jgi:hypothetical protein
MCSFLGTIGCLGFILVYVGFFISCMDPLVCWLPMFFHKHLGDFLKLLIFFHRHLGVFMKLPKFFHRHLGDFLKLAMFFHRHLGVFPKLPMLIS